MTTRTRTIEWEDPLASLAKARTMSGLEVMQAFLAGDLPAPPMIVTMNGTLTEASEGRVVFRSTPGEEHYNPLGTVHGGLVCTLLDSAAGCAAHTTLPAGVGYTSIELSVKYLKAVTADTGDLFTTGTVIKPGRRVIFADAVVTDAAGTIYATAQSSLLVIGG